MSENVIVREPSLDSDRVRAEPVTERCMDCVLDSVKRYEKVSVRERRDRVAETVLSSVSVIVSDEGSENDRVPRDAVCDAVYTFEGELVTERRMDCVLDTVTRYETVSVRERRDSVAEIVLPSVSVIVCDKASEIDRVRMVAVCEAVTERGIDSVPDCETRYETVLVRERRDRDADTV